MCGQCEPDLQMAEGSSVCSVVEGQDDDIEAGGFLRGEIEGSAAIAIGYYKPLPTGPPMPRFLPTAWTSHCRMAAGF